MDAHFTATPSRPAGRGPAVVRDPASPGSLEFGTDPRRPRALFALILGGALLAAPAAEAGFTLHGSAGATYILSGGGGVTADRGPVTFDVAPGLDLGFLRAELPFVFGVNGDDIYPAAPNGFLGLRPQLKIFPFDNLYAKVATQLLFPGDSEFYFGLSVGGGLEFKLARALAINIELNFNPMFTPSTVLPLEARAGATFFF